MRFQISTLALAAVVAAQSQGLVPSNPGGALPAGYYVPHEAEFYSGFGSNPSVTPSRGAQALCVSGFVNVTASTNMNVKFNFTLPQNQSQVTQTFLDMIQAGSTFSNRTQIGKQTINGTYLIGTTMCVPGNNTKPRGVQIATHGVGFDRTYWDWAPGYSYADLAQQSGYATFFYDRLGVGLSAMPDALNVVQAPLEVEILHGLVKLLRAGHFSNNTFEKVVGVGHSLGSIITQSLTALYPEDLDATVLTGFSTDSTGMAPFLVSQNLAIASQDQPYRYASVPQGYLVSGGAIAVQYGFFQAPGFDPQVLALANAVKGSVTFGELFTTASTVQAARNYTRPVAVVNGDNDLPFCNGNCTYPYNKAQAVFAKLYPNVRNSSTFTYLAPGCGHGLNLHYIAVRAYKQIQGFITSQVSL